MYRGERIPTAKEQWTLARSVRRLNIKDRNVLKNQLMEYESDDDFGENLGGADARDLDEEAEGQLDSDGEVIKKEDDETKEAD